ncbi:MAG TPA: hypothetical protein ENJ53_04020 [Phaeodactylibacter sp.]|nr:hypothetical protein [Phaeodactylibacter sp.]
MNFQTITTIKQYIQLSNVKALQIFQLFRQGAAILISIFLTKNLLSTEDIGIYEMLFYIGTTLSFFWVSGFLQGMLPLHPKLSETDKKRFLFNAYLLYLGLSTSLFLILFFARNWLVPALVGQLSLPYYNLFCFYLLFHLPSFLIEYIYLLNDRPKSIVLFGMAAFGGQVLLTILPLLLGWGLLWSFRLLLFLAMAKHVWLLLSLKNYALFQFNKNLLSEYIILSIPLVAYAFLGGFASFLDQWLVAWFFEGDEKVFAIFRYGARELPLATAFTAALSAALIPVLSKDLEKGIKEIKAKSLKLYHLLFPIAIVAILLSERIFPIVFNTDFRESALVFNIYLLAVASRLLFPQSILIAKRETKIILIISIIEMLLNIFLSFIFIQKWGIAGVAYATVIVFLFEKIAQMTYLYIKYKISIQTYTNVKYFIAYSILLFLVFVFTL